MTKEEFKKEFGIQYDDWHVETNYEPMYNDYYTVENDGVTLQYNEVEWGGTYCVTKFYSFEEFLERYKNDTLKD